MYSTEGPLLCAFLTDDFSEFSIFSASPCVPPIVRIQCQSVNGAEQIHRFEDMPELLELVSQMLLYRVLFLTHSSLFTGIGHLPCLNEYKSKKVMSCRHVHVV
jgi:hypothetical protein